MALPPGISESQFSRILREFEDAVGSEWVFSSPEDVALYRDSYSIYWGEKEERVASAAVAPSSVEEVQAVVRIANQYGVPIYPISTGRNLTLIILKDRLNGLAERLDDVLGAVRRSIIDHDHLKGRMRLGKRAPDRCFDETFMVIGVDDDRDSQRADHKQPTT